jgi:hypothetical protein
VWPTQLHQPEAQAFFLYLEGQIKLETGSHLWRVAEAQRHSRRELQVRGGNTEALEIGGLQAGVGS